MLWHVIDPRPPPGSCVRLHSSSRRLPAKPNRREPTIVLLDDTRKSSSKATLLSLEFDGVCNTTPAANQARAEEQSAAYARVIIQPRGSLCYRMTGQLSPETEGPKMTILRRYGVDGWVRVVSDVRAFMHCKLVGSLATVMEKAGLRLTDQHYRTRRSDPPTSHDCSSPRIAWA
jgi:hypothetical protein